MLSGIIVVTRRLANFDVDILGNGGIGGGFADRDFVRYFVGNFGTVGLKKFEGTGSPKKWFNFFERRIFFVVGDIDWCIGGGVQFQMLCARKLDCEPSGLNKPVQTRTLSREPFCNTQGVRGSCNFSVSH